jgi:hypothetical protein
MSERMKPILMKSGHIRISLIEVREFLRMPQLRHWDDITPALKDKLEVRWALHQRLGHMVLMCPDGLRKTLAEEVYDTVLAAEEMGD